VWYIEGTSSGSLVDIDPRRDCIGEATAESWVKWMWLQ
jgi:hypothetical protein